MSTGSHQTRHASVSLQAVGPLKRTTFDPSAPDDDRQRLNDVLHWSNGTRLQVRRLFASLKKDFPFTWTRWSKQRRLSSAATFDAHMLLIAAGNLDKSLNRLPRKWRSEITLATEERRALRLLRNIEEHWEKLRTAYRSGGQLEKAAKELRDRFPTAEPWSMTIDLDSGEVTMGGAVPLRKLVKQLRIMEARILRTEREVIRATRKVTRG